MQKKLLVIYMLTFCITSSYAQEKRKLIYGKVSDSIGIIKNANIINLKTKQGTFSNDQGLFRIFASKGDTLNFSSIQHTTKKIVVTENILKQKEIQVLLKSNIYSLDEVIVKKNNLQGILTSDINEVPKNKKDSILKDNLNFSNIDFTQVDSRIDKNIRAMPKIRIVDPNKKFEGLNLKGFLSLKKSKPYKPITKDTFNKSEVPDKLLIELGEDYFFKTLKIPKQNYNHFLEFCDLTKIINLYKKGKLLEIIQTLQDQSTLYLKVIKEK